MLQGSSICLAEVTVSLPLQRATSEERTAWICEQARAIGFDLCGVTPAGELPSDRGALTRWLERGFAGEMKYLYDPRRLDPATVLEGARSVVVLGLNYNAAEPYSSRKPTDDQTPYGWISRYAWGEDYHTVVGKMLDALTGKMRAEIPEAFTARAYVDTGPISERSAAHAAGLGWVAKNTLLIHPELGLVGISRGDSHHFGIGADGWGGRPGGGPVRELHPLHRRLSYPGDHGALRARCAALHFIFDHRVARSHS